MSVGRVLGAGLLFAGGFFCGALWGIWPTLRKLWPHLGTLTGRDREGLAILARHMGEGQR